MPDYTAFIAESVSNATFGRVNLYGVNFGRVIFVPVFPYALTASFVVLLRLNAGEAVGAPTLRLTSDWWKPLTYECGTFDPSGDERTWSIVWSRLLPIITGEGVISLGVSHDGGDWQRDWEVRQGSGPYRATVTEMVPSGLLGRQMSQNPLGDILREVRDEILIADQFITPEFLEGWLPNAGFAWRVKVIVGHRGARFVASSSGRLKRIFPQLEIRRDDLIHDRLICRDNEEIFVFGHSLKDLHKGRISFFQRIHDLEQAKEALLAVAESWARAKIVI